MRDRCLLLLTVVGCTLSAPAVAFANIGVPMIAVVYPGMGLLLIPIMVLEALIIQRRLGIERRRAFLTSISSNALSTIVGVPLTWIALFSLQALVGGGSPGPSIQTLAGKLFAVTVQAPWMMPEEAELYWMVPTATLVLLVPFLFMSWLVEYQLSKLFIRDGDRPTLRRAVLIANLWSYALLAAVVLAWLGYGVITNLG